MWNWRYDVPLAILSLIGFFGTWWHIGAGPAEPPVRTSVFGYNEGQAHVWTDPIALATMALFMVAVILLLFGYLRRTFFAIGAGAVLAMGVMHGFVQFALAIDVRSYDGFDPTVRLGIGGPAMVGVAFVALLRYQAMAPGDATTQWWRRKQGWPIVAALALALAAQAVPMFAVDVTLDTEHVYDLEGTAQDLGPTVDDTMQIMVWGRVLSVPFDSGFHPWWDNHYIGKDGNGALYVAGIMSVAGIIAGIVATRVRHPVFLFVLAGWWGAVMGVLLLGTAGELSTDEYAGHGPIMPAWGLFVPAGIIAAYVTAGRLQRPMDIGMPALPEPDRHP